MGRTTEREIEAAAAWAKTAASGSIKYATVWLSETAHTGLMASSTERLMELAGEAAAAAGGAGPYPVEIEETGEWRAVYATGAHHSAGPKEMWA